MATIYDQPTPRGRLGVIVSGDVVTISRHFEDIAHTDEVTLQRHELDAIIAAIKEAS